MIFNNKIFKVYNRNNDNMEKNPIKKSDITTQNEINRVKNKINSTSKSGVFNKKIFNNFNKK